MSKATGLNCGIPEQDRPLLILKFRDKDLYICPQCLPILIHKPYELTDKIPGFVPPESGSADDH